MKVMALGNEAMLKRLLTPSPVEDVDVIGSPTIEDAITKLQRDGFDVVVIDGVAEAVGIICRLVRASSPVPIVLVIRGTEANWQKLDSFDIDGFISDGAGRAETVARLKAVSRRSRSSNGKGRDGK